MSDSELLKMPWFQELCAEVASACNELLDNRHDQAAALTAEKNKLHQQVNGWDQSLANPNLPLGVRSHIEQQSGHALERINNVEAALREANAIRESQLEMIDSKVVREQLARLEEVLAGTNPSQGNVELAQHIDRINCFDDGRIVIRTCKLGSLAGAVDMFSTVEKSMDERNTVPTLSARQQSRRLTRRQIVSADRPTVELKSRITWATDPSRFSGLNERWFEEFVLQVPKHQSWAETNAAQVALRRKQNMTEQQLAEHFEVSLPTIRKALKIAKRSDPELLALPRRMPRSKWHEDNALEVARLKADGMSTLELAKFFETSDTTIRSASL